MEPGIAVVFAGERSPGRWTMDNACALGRHLDPHAAGEHAAFCSGSAADRRLVVHLFAPGDPR